RVQYFLVGAAQGGRVVAELLRADGCLGKDLQIAQLLGGKSVPEVVNDLGARDDRCPHVDDRHRRLGGHDVVCGPTGPRRNSSKTASCSTAKASSNVALGLLTRYRFRHSSAACGASMMLRAMAKASSSSRAGSLTALTRPMRNASLTSMRRPVR